MMFSRNPFSHLSPTIHVFPPSNSFLDNQKHDLHTNPFLFGDSFPAPENFPAAEHNLAQELGLKQFDNEYNPPLFWPVVKNKKAAKKDHHSKIDTAQGPRDRRVRLSTEVAKKFFYLQDLLGVDKASKTLDWLFQKSKISIDELIKRKKETSSPAATDQSEVTFMEAGTDEGRKKKNSEGKRKKMVIRKCKSGFSVNQSRAEARARARERTREKQLIVKKLDNEYKSVHVDCCSSNLTLQSRFWHSVETQSDQIGESVMEDNLSMLYGFQHNPSGHCNDLDPLEVLVSSHAATMF